jgi:carboxyl-terminal processing protease
MKSTKNNDATLAQYAAWGVLIAFLLIFMTSRGWADDKLTFKDAADVIKTAEIEFYRPLDPLHLVAEFRKALVDTLKEAGLDGGVAGAKADSDVDASLGDLAKAVESTHLSPTARSRIIHRSLSKMLASLDEAGTKLETTDVHFQTLKETGYDKGGAGLFIEENKDELGRFIVIETLPHFAIERSGIETGDRIIMVDGRSIKTLSYRRLADLIRGPIGSEVSITYEKPRERKPRTVTIQRKWLAPNFKSVSTRMLGDQVLYIRIKFLGENLDAEISRLLKSPEFSKARRIVFDLRNNGGNLEGGRALAGSFLSPGTILVSRVEGKNKEVFRSISQTLPQLSMAILINEKSGSPSVLFAGILQDYGRALVVGMPSKWEDHVTKTHALPDGSVYSITSGSHVLPKGRVLINKTGIKPDVTVKKDPFTKTPLDEDGQLQKALELLKKT